MEEELREVQSRDFGMLVVPEHRRFGDCELSGKLRLIDSMKFRISVLPAGSEMYG